MATSDKNTRLAATIENDPRWLALRSRDTRAEGTFFYSVRTTGIYCRPGCPARAPRPENVAFHASAADAQRAGFRPCRRCQPDQPSAQQQRVSTITAACRRIEQAETPPSLQQLADAAGLSPFHFHRVFKALTGVTPKQYADQHRFGRARDALIGGQSVTDAMFDAGYNASSRFYEHTSERLGMTPTDYRSGAADNTIHFAIGQCSLGAVLVAQSERGVCAIALGDDAEALARELQDAFPKAHLIGGDRDYEERVAQVIGFIEAPALGLDLPLDVRGTAFQQRVWQALRDIPPGSTASYSDIARRIGSPSAVRAVAQACAANKLAVAIPCHRVVRHDGGLSGYRWGVERKRALLEREAKT
jgi:AraC family transcriptional regulator of adaptative response/methylated-DNA-[protein]-cysteine methyltransferase